MPLESCMILLDNSEYMRNGDYIPTRLEAQQDAANLLVGAKTQSHPESTVGVSAGTELLVSPTDDVGKILNALHGVPLKTEGGNVTASMQVASLALKHRRNKNGAQRIVLFVGSPLHGVETRALQKAGRTLKKNNVAIDVVAMGELEANEEKLRELVNAANGRGGGGTEDEERTCHLITIPAGVLPSDVLSSSPIVHGGSGGSAFAASAAAAAASGNSGGGGGGGGGFGDFGGVDPNMDPELAMALRVSMEEERARQERLAQQQQQQQEQSQQENSEESKDADMAEASSAPAADASSSNNNNTAAAAAAMDMGLSEEEALLQQALAMSMNENEPAAAAPAAAAAVPEEEEEDEEAAAMQLALQMSLQASEQQEDAAKAASSKDEQVNELLGNLPGVNPNDPAIQNALRNLKKDDGDDGNDAKDKDADSKKRKQDDK
eukprot:scaffold6219_cov146-Cylindrotheca_fusiformis.AAC.7